MKNDFFRKALLIIILATNLTSCLQDTVNKMAIKKERNPINNELEEYRVVNISTDDEDKYFLKIKVPHGYVDIKNPTVKTSDFGNSYGDNFIKKNDYSEVFRINKGLYPNKTLDEYVKWRKDYMYDKFDMISSSIENDNSLAGFKSALIFYELKCTPSATKICFPGQSEIAVIRAYKKGDESHSAIWDIQYESSLDGNLSKEEKDAKINRLKSMAKNCCRIISQGINKI